MKTIKNLLFLIFTVAIFTNSISQTYSDDALNLAANNFQTKSSQLNFISSQKIQTATTERSSQVANSIYIQQIGDYNTAVANTISNSSNIVISQNGNRNDVDLNIVSNRIDANIIQDGINNSFKSINTGNSKIYSADITQTGANQSLTWYGRSNSVSEGLIVNMQGQNMGIIIRNL